MNDETKETEKIVCPICKIEIKVPKGFKVKECKHPSHILSRKV